jgi:hypothetical protein
MELSLNISHKGTKHTKDTKEENEEMLGIICAFVSLCEVFLEGVYNGQDKERD